MKWSGLLLLIIVILITGFDGDYSIFLSKDFVNLRGQESLTIIRNSTSDTLHLKGSFFNDLPYSENRFVVSIPPKQQDTIRLFFTFPDFIHIESPEYMRLYNMPGKVVHCEILDLNSRSVKIKFQGEAAAINDYYLAYHNQFGSSMENNRPYFALGDLIKDFNKFPAGVDSINALSRGFLHKYCGELPSWFKTHEDWRLKYLAGFIKHNVLLTKEFYGGKKIKVSSNYFSYERELPLQNDKMIFNNQYLWYVRMVIGRETRLTLERKKQNPERARFDLSMVDSLFKGSAVGDLLKMDQLSMIYHSGFQTKYDSLMNEIVFRDQEKKIILDSLVKIKYGLPAMGRKIPELSLIDLNARRSSFMDFKGKYIIVNFWATWCGPCIKEFPEENKLYSMYKDKGLLVVNICVDSDKNQWTAVSQARDLKMINLFSSKDQFPYITKKFGIAGLPKSILIDKDLNVIDNNFKRASELTRRDVERILSGR